MSLQELKIQRSSLNPISAQGPKAVYKEVNRLEANEFDRSVHRYYG
jgi:hypothetical protein